jgi:hypothetical protein
MKRTYFDLIGGPDDRLDDEGRNHRTLLCEPPLSGLGYQPLSAAGTWIAHLQPRGATAPYRRSIAGPSGAAPAGIAANPRFRGTGLAQTA